jgi:hypothetical protein
MGRVEVHREALTFFAFSDRLVRADAGRSNSARNGQWPRLDATLAPCGSRSDGCSLGGDHIELRHIGANTAPAADNLAVNRRTTAVGRAIAQCHSRRLAPERIAAGQSAPLSKPGRWVLALYCRWRIDTPRTFSNQRRKVPIGREVHATLTPVRLNRIR